jgi:hypothetical protein
MDPLPRNRVATLEPVEARRAAILGVHLHDGIDHTTRGTSQLGYRTILIAALNGDTNR